MRPSHFIAISITLALSVAPGMIRAAVDGGTIPVDQLGLIPLPRLVTAYENKWQLPATVHIAAPSPSESKCRRVSETLSNPARHSCTNCCQRPGSDTTFHRG